MRRFFVLQQNINEKENFIKIIDEEFKHLKNVLRLNIGDELVCFSGDGYDYICKLEELNANFAVVKINQIVKNLSTPTQNISVFQGSLKSDKYEYLIQKLAELGVRELTAFESAFSVAKLKQDKLERYNKIAISASKQCQRADILNIGDNLTFKQMLLKLENFDLVIFAYEKENAVSLKNVNFSKFKDKNIALIIGSEGGFSQKEFEEIIAKNAISISLGNRILRAETAPVVAVSVIMFLLGEI